MVNPVALRFKSRSVERDGWEQTRMQAQKLTMNDRVLVLASAEEAKQAEQRIVEAVQAGGGFVQLVLFGGNTLRVLVSSGTVAFLEVVELDPGEAPESATGWPYEWDYLPDAAL